MKIKDGFAVCEVAGRMVVIAADERAQNVNAMITLNDTAHFLWERMQVETNADALVAALLDEYEVEEERARVEVDAFVARLGQEGLLA